MCMAVAKEEANQVAEELTEMGMPAYVIGEIVEGEKGVTLW